MKPVLFFGEALMDQFCDAAGELQSSLPGGSVLNAAVGAARLGLPAAFGGGIGGDEEGRALLRLLNREHIAHRFAFYKKDRATAAAEVRLDAKGQPIFAFRRAGCADEAVTPDDVEEIDPNDFSGLHCGGVMLASEPGASAQERLAEKFYDAAVPVSFDLNVRPALIADKTAFCERALKFMIRPQLVKFSRDDIEWFFPGEDVNDSFAAMHQARRGALTVLTAGVQGSLIASGQVCERLFAYSVAVADTTGCGDGYAAGLLRGLFSLPDATAWDELTAEQARWVGSGASSVAARVCEKQGAIAAMPRYRDIYSADGTHQ